MSFVNLRDFLEHLAATRQLKRVRTQVDPNQEVTVIQHQVIQRQGPALLFEHVKGSKHRLVTNLFGTPERVQAVFQRPPEEIGAELVELAERLMPPKVSSLWTYRRRLLRLLKARLRNVRRGPILENLASSPRLDELPCLTCWPLDGGAFFTLPLVHTTDPENGRGNLGIYRMQRYDAATTGMHWQIEKGGAFHFHKACEKNMPLPVSVFLGGPPALTISAIAPLPEGIDERLLAALIMNRPLDVIARPSTGHRIPAQAEFVLEGTVRPGETRKEGPFGDHLGHYSHSAEFPIFRVDRVLMRNDAVFPATVVGKPPQEDYYIGCALQEMILPLTKIIMPGLDDVWSYPESGFHPLAVLSAKERYPREALKYAMWALGQGQLSLTKVLMVMPAGVNVRDIESVSRAVWSYLDAESGIHLLAPTAQDTLDFTGPAMNTGSRLIVLASPRDGKPLRDRHPPMPPPARQVHSEILGFRSLGPAFLIAAIKPGADTGKIREAMARHTVTKEYLFHVLVSDDVDLSSNMSILWGWFTRFDPLADLHPAGKVVQGNRLVFDFPIAIDATWKPGYRKPVAFDPEIEKMVQARWFEYDIDNSGDHP